MSFESFFEAMTDEDDRMLIGRLFLDLTAAENKNARWLNRVFVADMIKFQR